MKKYYWVSTTGWWYGRKEDAMLENYAIAEHPFEYDARLNKTKDWEQQLLNWREISEEEYNLFKKLNAE